MPLLEMPVVRGRFGLSEEDTEPLRRWVDDVRVRWGYDAATRGEDGFPAFSENSWRAGLDRMLLGYAMEGGIFRGTLSYDAMEGAAADRAGEQRLRLRIQRGRHTGCRRAGHRRGIDETECRALALIGGAEMRPLDPRQARALQESFELA